MPSRASKKTGMSWKNLIEDGLPQEAGAYVCILIDEDEAFLTGILEWIPQREAFRTSFPQPWLEEAAGVVSYHKIEELLSLDDPMSIN